MDLPGTAGFSGRTVADEQNDSIRTLRSLSESTGGFAAVNRNDFAGAFQRILDDSSSYYVVGVLPGARRQAGRVSIDRGQGVAARRPHQRTQRLFGQGRGAGAADRQRSAGRGAVVRVPDAVNARARPRAGAARDAVVSAGTNSRPCISAPGTAREPSATARAADSNPGGGAARRRQKVRRTPGRRSARPRPPVRRTGRPLQRTARARAADRERRRARVERNLDRHRSSVDARGSRAGEEHRRALAVGAGVAARPSSTARGRPGRRHGHLGHDHPRHRRACHSTERPRDERRDAHVGAVGADDHQGQAVAGPGAADAAHGGENVRRRRSDSGRGRGLSAGKCRGRARRSSRESTGATAPRQDSTNGASSRPMDRAASRSVSPSVRQNCPPAATCSGSRWKRPEPSRSSARCRSTSSDVELKTSSSQLPTPNVQGTPNCQFPIDRKTNQLRDWESTLALGVGECLGTWELEVGSCQSSLTSSPQSD